MAMKFRGLLIAAVVLLVLAGVLYWSEHRKTPETTATATAPAQLVPVRAAAAEHTNGNGNGHDNGSGNGNGRHDPVADDSPDGEDDSAADEV